MSSSMLATRNQSREPFFVQFRRDIAQREKTALSNPTQLLRLLTGQDHLHHPFILIGTSQKAARTEASASTRQCGAKVVEIRQKLRDERAQKTVAKSKAALSEDAYLAQLRDLEQQPTPQSTEDLLLNLLLGTGRVVDDVRGLRNIRRAVPDVPSQALAVSRAMSHLAAAIRGMRPITLELPEVDVSALGEELSKHTGQDGDEFSLRRAWPRGGLVRQVTKHRPLLALERQNGGRVGVQSRGACSWKALAYLFTCTGRWFADFGPRTARAYDGMELRALAGHLWVLSDILLSDEYFVCHDASMSQAVDDARLLACELLQAGEAASANSHFDPWRLHLRFLGTRLRSDAIQAHDPRVPWPCDVWQQQLLDAVDSSSGALVLAPTSAGKTFAAYYVMERVLRVSNTHAVLFVAPTEALAAQVEAEVHARFGQKPYPHDGFLLCAALVPGRSRQLVCQAQIIIAIAGALDEVLSNEQLWSRLRWVVCDEIHLQPLPAFQALARQCGTGWSGSGRVPLLAMSATIQQPDLLHGRLVRATQSSGFRLVHHDERVVDLRTMRWDDKHSRLGALHPLLLHRSKPTVASLRGMASEEMLALFDAMHSVAPRSVGMLTPRSFFTRLRLGPVASRFKIPLNASVLILDFIGSGRRMASRQESRVWERQLVGVLETFTSEEFADVLSLLRYDAGCPQHMAPPSSPDLDTHGFMNLLDGLKAQDLLPCICFHQDKSYLEELLIATSQVLRNNEEEAILAKRAFYRKATDEWKVRLELLRERLAGVIAEARRRGRAGKSGRHRGAACAEEARSEDSQKKEEKAESKAEADGEEDTEERDEDEDEDEEKDEDEDDEDAEDEGKDQDVEFDPLLQAALNDLSAPPTVKPKRGGRDVESDPQVKECRRELEDLEALRPSLDDLQTRDVDFTGFRARHVYGAEIELLLSHVEAGFDELAKRDKTKRRSQALSCALRHGIAMHLPDSGCEVINFAVLMLFRMGHVRVLLADEALGCGMNLPCRAGVIMDASIDKTMLKQMAGRAGRRGLDLFGATVFVHDLPTLLASFGS